MVANSPGHGQALLPGESLISHAFFKQDNGADYFPGLVNGSDITISSTTNYSSPVQIVDDTVMFHVRWNDQSDMLDPAYFNGDNHYTLTNSFRDLDSFLATGSFANLPVQTYILGSPVVQWNISGNGTDTITVDATFPYDALRNFEEDPNNPRDPMGLPAPGGFLEPFHFHIEFAVMPEPTVLAMLAGAAGLAVLRRRDP